MWPITTEACTRRGFRIITSQQLPACLEQLWKGRYQAEARDKKTSKVLGEVCLTAEGKLVWWTGQRPESLEQKPQQNTA